MLSDPRHQEHLDKLEAQLRGASAITAELVFGVIGQACTRFAAHSANTRAKLSQLIEAGAWTDAVLALIELELPHWKLRRLVYEDSAWLCSLSKQPQLPIGLDEVAEGSHEALPLAILSALIEARRAATADAVSVTTVPQVRPAPGYAMCCDNLA